MKRSLDERIKDYVTQSAPLGPPDAHQIKDDEVAAKLIDPHNKSFNALLRKEISIVIGRRGSGKTALLNSYRYHRYFESGSFLKTNFAGVDLKRYHFVFEVKTHSKFEELRKLATGEDGFSRPIESVIEDWNQHVLDFFLAKLLDKAPQRGSGQRYLKKIATYLYQGEDVSSTNERGAEEYSEKKTARLVVWGGGLWHRLFARFRAESQEIEGYITQDDAIATARLYLKEVKKRAILVFDSMDEYEVGNKIFDRTVAALLRFTSDFNNSSDDNIRIKLGFPSEIVYEVRRASTNPLKDFVNYDLVQWSSTELLQIAAFRYRLFLQLFVPRLAEQLDHYDFYTREGVTGFWNYFFPMERINLYGIREDVLTYLLRHTQLLPRQLFLILQKIVVFNYDENGEYGRFSDKAVIASVEAMETEIALEIFGAFRHVYSEAERVGRVLFAGFETVFDYQTLETQWNRTRKQYVLHKTNNNKEMVDLVVMLLRMGIVGVVDGEDDRYVIGKFYYNALAPPNITFGTKLCLHPIFSRHFDAKLNSIGKAILPHGIDPQKQ